jgi:hypothetical protein
MVWLLGVSLNYCCFFFFVVVLTAVDYNDVCPLVELVTL